MNGQVYYDGIATGTTTFAGYDTYDGGNGTVAKGTAEIDKLYIYLSNEQLQNNAFMTAFTTELNAFQAFILANSNSNTGQAGQATFTFTSINLKVSAIECVAYGVDPNAPVLDLNGLGSNGNAGTGYATTFTEANEVSSGTGPIKIVDIDVSITDADDTNLVSATVTLTNAKADDVLAVNNLGLPPGITATITSAPGTITVTLTGSASLADYQTALRQITFSNSSDDPDTTNRIVTVVADDGDLTSNVATTTITVQAVNDAPVLTVDTSGSVTEDATTPNLTDSGTLSFTDVDVTDTHSTSATPLSAPVWSGGDLSTQLTPAEIAALTAGFTVDADSWDYTVANSLVQFLAEGETITFSYTVTVTDDFGEANNSDFETVTVTITGNNDAPVLTVDTSGSVTEDAIDPNLTDSGTPKVTDVDVTDTHSTSATPLSAPVWSGGGSVDAADAGVATALVAGFSVDQNSWDYTSSQNLDFLGEGETITFSYDVVATDDSGAANDASTPQTVTITITGTNDQPTLTIADDAGTMNEGNGTATLTDSGALSFTDLDVNDVVTVSKTYNGDIAWSGGTLDAGVATALVAGFSVDQNSWDYTSSQNLDFLGEDETITFSFDVVATDDSGAANDASTPRRSRSPSPAPTTRRR